jgi:hypothetical protein
MALAFAVVLSACVDPLGIDTPKRQWEVNLDSIVTSDPFIRAPGDSLRAIVDDEAIVFATEVLRPTFHNGVFRNAHYVTVQASRQSLNSPDYDILSLRLDAVTDTGSYAFNGSYSAPKAVDSMGTPVYAAQYERRSGGFPETYRTGVPRSGGHVRVAKIDLERGVMVGSFTLTAYCAERDTTVTIQQGTFRVQLGRR